MLGTPKIVRGPLPLSEVNNIGLVENEVATQTLGYDIGSPLRRCIYNNFDLSGKSNINLLAQGESIKKEPLARWIQLK